MENGVNLKKSIVITTTFVMEPEMIVSPKESSNAHQIQTAMELHFLTEMVIQDRQIGFLWRKELDCAKVEV